MINNKNNNKNKSDRSYHFVLYNQKNLPVLFNKKIRKFVLKPLKHIYSDTGKTRHYTPAAQE
jgi:hypothetical protein